MIWIIGAKGMLGQELLRQCDESGVGHVDSDIDVDITDFDALKGFADGLDTSSITWIVNCSAYTAVDRAEEEEERARSINALGVQNIARLAQGIGARVMHISTDYVFPGTEDQELSEEDAVGPVGAYGRTEREGERLLAAHCSDYCIIRTAWLYGRFGKNFVYTMLKLMDSKESIRVVDDQLGSPTLADDLVRAILEMIQRIQGASGEQRNRLFGLYHFSGSGRCSWFEFAGEIYRLGKAHGLLQRDCQVLPCSSDEYPTPAKRPAFSLLAKDKIVDRFNVSVPSWRDSLEYFIKSIDRNAIQ